MVRWGRVAFLLGFAITVASAARAQSVPAGFARETLVSTLDWPIAFDFLPGDRALFAEQFTARVRLVGPDHSVQPTPVITLAGVEVGGERGLLGLAVDPAFPARPYLYLFYTVSSPNRIRIARFTLTGDLDGTGGTDLTADPDSRHDIIDNAPDLNDIHNGGTVRFGLDGLLYASLGDDGIHCQAYAQWDLRGKLLRLRVDSLPPGPGSAFRAQIAPPDNPFADSPDSNRRLFAAYGLRNPFRFQVDPVLGTLVIGDVGPLVREELDLFQPPTVFPEGTHAPAGAGTLGGNYGWPWYEGTLPNSIGASCGAEPAGLIAPVFDYDRTPQGAASIIAAGFYRPRPGGGNNWPADHDGDLFTNDYYSGNLWRLEEVGGVWVLAPPLMGQPSPTAWGQGFRQVTDWRVAADGSFWYCRQAESYQDGTGSIGRIRGLGEVSVASGGRPSLRLVRTPAVGRAELRVVAEPALRVSIVDLAGRRLRTLWDGATPPAARGSEFPLVWDGRTDRGDRAHPGMYVALVESATTRASLRIPFLR